MAGKGGGRQGQSAMDIWARGKGTRVTTGRGKGQGSKMVYAGGTKVADKTGENAVDKYKPKAKTYASGSNKLDRAKRATFDESIAGSRADDPRNWEFHFKDPGKQVGKTTKGETVSAAGMTARARVGARSRAERDAKWTGQSVYDVRKIQYGTAGVVADTEQAGADAKAKGNFGSTKTAQNVAAQKMLSNRKASRGRARTTNAFEAPATKRGALA